MVDFESCVVPMRVTFEGGTPFQNMEQGARVCTATEDQWSHGFPYRDLPEDVRLRNSADFIERNALGRGHEALFEHGVLQFRIEGISRSLLQQLATHRIGISRLARSTRWTLKRVASIALPSGMPEELIDRYVACQQRNMQEAQEVAARYGNDWGKYFVSDGAETSVFLTVNVREMRHILALRSGRTVHPEFKELCRRLLDAVPEAYAAAFEDLRGGVVNG